MTLLAEVRNARRDESVARLRRAIALRALVATGYSQREIAEGLGISQSAVSQQLKAAAKVPAVDSGTLVEAAAPVLRRLAEEEGYEDLAVFGSVARGEATDGSDVDLLVRAPAGTSSFDFVSFRELLERVLDREVDLVEYGGLKPGVDDDIRREAVRL